jgi:hypothetical protein
MPLELRWIFERAPPSHVLDWFLKCDSLWGNVGESTNQDTYLFIPEASYLSVKIRDKELVIKWKRSSFPFELKSKGLDGTIEEWFSWKWTDNKAAERIGKFVETDNTSPWFEVRKERRRYNFQYRGHDLIPVGGKDQYDCSLELVTLTPNRAGSLKWWSIGVDLFSEKKIEEQLEDMTSLSNELLREIPLSDLTADSSYSYPKLFQLYQVAIS